MRRLGAILSRAHTRHGWWLPVLALAGWAHTIVGTGRWPAGDGPHILGIAMRLAQMLREGALAEFSWCFPSLLAPHPPLAYAPATLAYFVLGGGRWAHLAAGAFVLFLCWDGLRRLSGSVVSAHLGLLWLAAAGVVWQQAESYGIDLVAGAFVVQALSHLAASRQLRSHRHAALWGAWMGAAFLAKYTAPMFLWAPCLIAAVWVVRRGRWAQLGAGIAGWAVVALPWYVQRGAEVLSYATTSNTATAELSSHTSLVAGAWWAAENLGWYPAVLIDNIGVPGVVAVALGLWLPFRAGSPRSARWIVILAVLGGWAILANQMQRQGRYLLPALPLLVLFPAVVRGRLLLAPIAVLGAWGALQLYAVGGNTPTSRQLEFNLATAGASWPFPPEPLRPMSESIDKWNLTEAAHALAQVVPEGTQTVGFLASDHGGPTTGLMLYALGLQGHSWNLASVAFMRSGPGGGPAGAELPQRNGAAVFIAPFAIGDWPDRHFDHVISILKAPDSRRTRWLAETGFTPVATFTTWPEWSGQILQTAPR